MATGVSGSAGTAAAQHVGLGHSSGGGGVNVPHLDQGAGTALASDPREKVATFSNVQVYALLLQWNMYRVDFGYVIEGQRGSATHGNLVAMKATFA